MKTKKFYSEEIAGGLSSSLANELIRKLYEIPYPIEIEPENLFFEELDFEAYVGTGGKAVFIRYFYTPSLSPEERKKVLVALRRFTRTLMVVATDFLNR